MTTRPLKQTKPRTLATPDADKFVEQQKISYIAGGSAKLYGHFTESFKTYHTLTIVSRESGIYPNELKACVHTKTCI